MKLISAFYFSAFFFLLLASSGQAYQVQCLTAEKGLDQICARSLEDDASCPPGTFAWDQESCLNQNKNSLISDIIDKQFREPISRSTYEKYSTKKIAESLVARFTKAYRFLIQPKDLTPTYDLYHNTSVMMAIHANDFPSILEKGFLNQHQLGKTSGVYTPTNRGLTEDTLIGANISGILSDEKHLARSNFLRPKYAYLFFDVAHQGIARSWVQDRYGEVFVKFKDQIKRRSTFTNGDSLDHVGINLQRPQTQGFTIDTFYTLKKDSSFKNLGFYEAQIWGELNADDINYLLVGCFNGIPSNQLQIIEALKKAKKNIPVYTCESFWSGGRWLRWIPGEQLYP